MGAIRESGGRKSTWERQSPVVAMKGRKSRGKALGIGDLAPERKRGGFK